VWALVRFRVSPSPSAPLLNLFCHITAVSPLPTPTYTTTSAPYVCCWINICCFTIHYAGSRQTPALAGWAVRRAVPVARPGSLGRRGLRLCGLAASLRGCAITRGFLALRLSGAGQRSGADLRATHYGLEAAPAAALPLASVCLLNITLSATVCARGSCLNFITCSSTAAAAVHSASVRWRASRQLLLPLYGRRFALAGGGVARRRAEENDGFAKKRTRHCVVRARDILYLPLRRSAALAASGFKTCAASRHRTWTDACHRDFLRTHCCCHHCAHHAARRLPLLFCGSMP